MVVPSIILSVIFALLFVTVLVYGFRRKGPGAIGGFLFLFFIIFMFTWAADSWMEPVGPVSWGVPWLGYLVVAFIIMLLLGALLPPFVHRTGSLLSRMWMKRSESAKPLPTLKLHSVFFLVHDDRPFCTAHHQAGWLNININVVPIML